MKIEESSWLLKNTKVYPELKQNIKTDILVIGAGITGVIAAYLLAKEGKDVVLIEKKDILNSTTAYTTAFITQLIDTSLTDQVKLFGENKTKMIWSSHGDAISLIEKLVHEEKIPCEFTRCDLFQYANTEKQLKTLQEEYATAKNLDFPFQLSTKNTHPFPTKGSIKIPNQAKFHPIKFTTQLLEKAVALGASVYFQTKALDILDEDPAKVTTTNTTITANHVIIATHVPFHNPIEMFAKKGIYTSYVYELSVPKNTIPDALYLDAANPYHYFRIDSFDTHDRIIIGGEDHRRDIPVSAKKSYDALLVYIKRIFPSIDYTITRRWSGSIVENDAIAYIGKIKKNQYIATGFSGNGMTYGTIAGILFRDIITKKKTQWENLYNPKRIPSLKQIITKGVDYTEEFFNGAVKNTIK